MALFPSVFENLADYEGVVGRDYDFFIMRCMPAIPHFIFQTVELVKVLSVAFRRVLGFEMVS